MASTKDIFEAKLFAANIFASGVFRGTGAAILPSYVFTAASRAATYSAAARSTAHSAAARSLTHTASETNRMNQ